MRFTFMAKHRGIWPVAWLCEAQDVSRSGFHAWLNRSPSRRARDEEEIGSRVRASFRGSDRTYGARRVWRDVLAEGVNCGLHRIERLMRVQALHGRPRRRSLPGRSSDRPSRRIRSAGSSMPSVRTSAGSPNSLRGPSAHLYLDRRGLALRCSRHRPLLPPGGGLVDEADMTAGLVTDALMMAIWRRGRPDALLHHSDQGSQGGFNRPSQRSHHTAGQGTDRAPRLVFSIRAFCGVAC